MNLGNLNKLGRKSLLAISLGIVILAVGFLVFHYGGNDAPVSRSDTAAETIGPEPLEEEEPAEKDSDPESTPAPATQDYASIHVLVNKQNPLPSSYVPANLRLVDIGRLAGKPDSELMLRDIAADAAETMAAAASEGGANIDIGSGYRSYSTQAAVYNNYVATYGQEEADTFSARPGTSEHQTGLALDVVGGNGSCWVEVCFENTTAGMWVKDNAHKYGFVIRYPKGKQSITGYQYEPWHLRYVGIALASELYENDLTLEEYYAS